MKDKEVVRIYNKSSQMIPIQARVPGGDFYRNEYQIRLNPGKDVQMSKSHLRMEQIINLQQRGIIRVLYDSEKES